MKYGLLFHYWMDTPDAKRDYIEVAKKIAKAGFDVIEIDGGDLYRMSADEMKALKDTTDSLGLEISVNCGPSKETDMASTDPAIRANGIRFFSGILRQMPGIGSKTMIGGLCTAWPVDWTKEYDKQVSWNNSVNSIREVCKVAEELGITIHLEVLNRFESYIVNDTAEGLKYIGEVGSPNMKLLLDTFHMNIEEDNMPAAMRLAGDKLGHLHLGEANRKLPGLGSLPWAEMGQALKDVNFDGFAVIEPFMLQNGPFGKAVHLWRDFTPGVTPEQYDQMLLDSLAFLKKNFGA
ncbi:MAG: sugar phosphate isomerase/epimerase [Eubacteriales bacterium]|nr:sugar phosphate isomerase/epimerase [Eubacteriales bacterium]